MVTEDSAVDMSFALISGERSRASEAERERMLKRIGAGVAVVLLHFLFFAVLLTAGHFVLQSEKTQPKEIVFILPPLAPPVQKTKPVETQVPLTKPIETPLHTITLPPPVPKTQTQSQTDVMQNIGKELACGAGPYEHLSQTQREACRRQPWKFKKNPKGVIVLDVPPKLQEEQPTTGADEALHTQQTTDACVASGSTHTECIHKTIFGR